MKTSKSVEKEYHLPSTTLLDSHDDIIAKTNRKSIRETSGELEKTLEAMGIGAHLSKVSVGPQITRFEVALAPGVRVEKLLKFENEIALALKAQNLRFVAPIPGKDAVGIEVPNEKPSTVYLRPLLESDAWNKTKATVPILLGRGVKNKPSILDLTKAPHLLIAASTKTEKSAFLNTLILSLLFRFSQDELNIILISTDIELQRQYLNVPHMIIPAVKDHHDVWRAIQQAEMQIHDRYLFLYKVKAKTIASFNSRPSDQEPVLDDKGNVIPQKLPIIVVIVDELSDAMKGKNKIEAETDICRIALKGRAAGIHLVVATNSPQRNVISGLIKANLPTKIAFRVKDEKESLLILDCKGAERLLGNGDMLFNPPGTAILERIQGIHISDDEINRVINAVSGKV